MCKLLNVIFLGLLCFELTTAATKMAKTITTHSPITNHPSKIPTALPSTQRPSLSPSSIPTTLSPTLSNQPTSTPTLYNGIQYHGGRVFINPVIYILWYGSWPSQSIRETIEGFVKNINHTSYSNILTTYYSVAKAPGNNSINSSNNIQTHISNNIVFGGSAMDNYSYGINLTETTVHQALSNAITNHHLSYNSDGVYIMLSSGDVAMPGGFCSSFCGWHSSFGSSIVPLTYSSSAFIGWASACPDGCAGLSRFANSTNGRLVDAMINVMSHEIMEAITDPFGIGWNNPGHGEIGDKCGGSLSPLLYDSTNDDKTYNIILNDVKYTIQQIWVNARGGYCSWQYP